LAAPSHEELVESIAAGGLDFARRGITSVHEAGIGAQAVRAYQAARDSGRLAVRVYLMLDPSDEAFFASFLGTGLATGFGDDWLKIGPVKLMVDGSSSGPTAATREPYAVDSSDRGILCLARDEIDRRFAEAHRAGFQVTAHAVGDRAIEMVIDGIEQAMAADASSSLPARPWRCGPRHRIEHCAMTDPALRSRIKALGIVPVLQPVFLYEFGDGYVSNYGPVRAARMFAAGSFRRAGVTFAMSTDCPVTFPDPMLNVYEAATRVTMSGATVGPEERMGGKVVHEE